MKTLLALLMLSTVFINQIEYKHRVIKNKLFTIVLFDNEVTRFQIYEGSVYDSYTGEE